MSHDSQEQRERQAPAPSQEHVLCVLEESCRTMQPRRNWRGRPAEVSGMRLCVGVILGIVQGWSVQLDVWRWICCEAWGPFAPVRVSDQAIYNRLARLEKPMHLLFAQVSQRLRQMVDPWQDRSLAPFATEVLALDESTLDQVGRWLPWLRPLASGKQALLAGRLSALLDVRRQQWVRVDVLKKAKANCKDHASAMLGNLARGTLILLDRGYLSFALFDEMGELGLWWISRYANKVSYRISHVCYQADGVLDAVVYLGAYRADQAKYPVRLIQFRRQGKWYRYLTNVLDPHLLPMHEVVKLYARRWDVELAFRLLKDFLQLNELWSAKWSVIQVQIWACLVVAQIYHALQVQIAVQAGVDVFDVSLDLLVRLTPKWLQRGLSPVEHAVRFGHELGIIRPSTRHRIEIDWVDPALVAAPPPEAVQPREQVRHRPPNPKRKKAST